MNNTGPASALSELTSCLGKIEQADEQSSVSQSKTQFHASSTKTPNPPFYASNSGFGMSAHKHVELARWHSLSAVASV